MQEHTESDRFELPGAVQELNADTLKEIRQNYASDTVKVLNLRKLLQKKVVDESRSKPFLISIGERAEAVAEAYENRQLTTQQALIEFEKLAEENNQASIERAELKLDENAYAIYKVLKNADDNVTPEQARDLSKAFDNFPDYKWDPAVERALRWMLILALKPHIGTENLIELTNALMKLERI